MLLCAIGSLGMWWRVTADASLTGDGDSLSQAAVFPDALISAGDTTTESVSVNLLSAESVTITPAGTLSIVALAVLTGVQ